MGCNSSGTQLRRYEAFISNTRLRRHRDEDHGGRSGVREACEPAQRVLDDLVQGHPILLLQRGVPAQVRLQAGALPRAYARTSSKPSRVVTVVRDLQVPHEVRSFQLWLTKNPKPWEPALLKAPQGLRRRHPRRSDRGARRREDSAEERNAAKEEQPVPRDDEGSLVRKETQIQIVR